MNGHGTKLELGGQGEVARNSGRFGSFLEHA